MAGGVTVRLKVYGPPKRFTVRLKADTTYEF